jgi:uncharacterized membrane protein
LSVNPLELIIPMLWFVAIYVVIPVMILWVLVRTIRGLRRPDPRTILADRLARHEITQADFETAMRALGLPDSRG